ncbi:hypothetical protein TPA0908_08320 [Micromonospora sp. AKA38]|nr:hypothetical protein TPA0908_08320 [Micromonospora sp. AKA38]
MRRLDAHSGAVPGVMSPVSVIGSFRRLDTIVEGYAGCGRRAAASPYRLLIVAVDGVVDSVIFDGIRFLA